MAEEEKGNKREEPPKRILLSLSVPPPPPRPFLSVSSPLSLCFFLLPQQNLCGWDAGPSGVKTLRLMDYFVNDCRRQTEVLK